jgi:nicotinate phosphoribosyltransferase
MLESPGLLTDLYQLTMAFGYYRTGRANRESVFHLFFRRSPFGSTYAIAAGLQSAIDYLQAYEFSEHDIDYLAGLPGNDSKPIFDLDFLHYLRDLKLTVDVDAIPEGTVVFEHQPLLRIRGPILQCQLLETALLNIINFQTLIATKASRLARVAKGDPVLEFGLRRAQGPDGAMSASRAAYIGGCAATSNVLAGKRYGIPIRGTHAHSWVMSFDSELEAFEAYASVMPNNCVFLVDTYDTLEGVRNAIEVAKQITSKGYRMVGIRLDSGDLAQLSIAARELLDRAGLEDAAIVASNDLDERLIESLKNQGACISLWGVGTKLASAYDQAALGGVYKLGAIQDDKGTWQHRIKLSEQMIKTSTPGIQQVRRFYDAHGQSMCDMIFDEILTPCGSNVLVPFGQYTKPRILSDKTTYEDLLVPIFRHGNVVYESPSIHQMRQRTQTQLKQFQGAMLRMDNPQPYPCGLELALHDLKMELIQKDRNR